MISTDYMPSLRTPGTPEVDPVKQAAAERFLIPAGELPTIDSAVQFMEKDKSLDSTRVAETIALSSFASSDAKAMAAAARAVINSELQDA